MTDLAELRRLAEAVTLRDWTYRRLAWTASWVENERGHEVVHASAEKAKDVMFIAAANPATVLALLDRLEAAEARCAALDEAVMRINAEHIDDVQRLTRERDEAERHTANRIAWWLERTYGDAGMVGRIAVRVRAGEWRDGGQK